MQEVKIGIRRQGAMQIFPGLSQFPELVINHPGVKEEACILSPYCQGFGHGYGGFVGLAVLMKGPGQDIIPVDVPSDFQLFLGQVESFLQLDIMVGIKVSQLAVVEHFVERVERTNIGHQAVLLLRVLSTSHFRIHIAEGGRIVWQGDHGDRLLIELDSLGIALLGRSHLCQSG
jgi:hypothetical protein